MRVPSPTSRNGKRVFLSLWDVFWALVSPILAVYLRDETLVFNINWTVVYYWVLSSGFSLLAFFALRIQDGMTRYFSVHQALDIAEAVLFAVLMTCAAMFTLTRLDGIPRSMPLIQGLVLASGLFAARIFVRVAFTGPPDPIDYRAREQRMILIGANPLAASFIQLLKACTPQRQPVIAVLDDDAAMIGRAISGVQILGSAHELESIIAEFSVHGVTTDRVVIASGPESLSSAVLQECERVCQRRQIELSFLPEMIGIMDFVSSEVAKTKIAPVEGPSNAVSSFFALKRGIDSVGALLLLALASPFLMVAGLLVLLDVGLPILFWQERLGWKGRAFLLYKFRTLRAPFDGDGKPILGGREPSAIGRFLRATRIDELPQLLNVLLGDMSLIGPRPLLREDQPSNTSLRLAVRPGITGWAQVNGAKLVSKGEKEKLDECYIRNASPRMDAQILVLTLKLLLRTRLSSVETMADVKQVQNKNTDVHATALTSTGKLASHRGG